MPLSPPCAPSPSGAKQPLETVVRTIGAGSGLLVLDNCEQVLNGVRPVVDAILERCRATRILATSREPLATPGESTLEVRALAVPADGAIFPKDLAGVPSVELFMIRATASLPGFTLSDANAPIVAAICRATDGLPLALELAAARTAVEGPPTVATSTGTSSAIGLRDQPGLSASLMRTVSTLDASEVELFSCLAAFNGPFTRDLAVGLAPNPGRADRDLDRLVRTAMVQKDDDAGHYRLLVPARQFGWDRLDEARRTAVARSHARLMLARAEQFDPLMRTDQEAAAVAAVRSEFADHRAAVQWFLDHNAVAESARLVYALFLFCLFQPQPEGHRWAALVADRLTGDEPFASDVAGAAAIGYWYGGDTFGAIETANRAVAMAANNGGSDFWARQALIYALGYVGDFDGVVPHYRALVNASRASDEPFWRTYGLGIEAISMSMFGRLEEGTRRAAEALALAQRVGNPECLNWAFYVLGRVLEATDPIGAGEAFEQAMRIAREVGSRFSVGLSLVEWVGLKRRLGELPMALAGTLDLLDLLAVSGNRSQLSEALREAGLLLADAGRHEQAALALLARRGLPAMPTDVGGESDDSGQLADLEREIGHEWSRLRIRAQALTEPELIGLCRDELARLQTGPLSVLPA